MEKENSKNDDEKMGKWDVYGTKLHENGTK
jgi:hypothetical protein